MPPGVSVISRYKHFWKSSTDITSGCVYLRVRWIDQSTSLPSGLQQTVVHLGGHAHFGCHEKQSLKMASNLLSHSPLTFNQKSKALWQWFNGLAFEWAKFTKKIGLGSSNNWYKIVIIRSFICTLKHNLYALGMASLFIKHTQARLKVLHIKTLSYNKNLIS